MSFFITFEGIDGCGKTTQLNMVANMLNDMGLKYIITREPGSTDLGLKLREILLHHNGFVAPTCELFLYLADRSQHIETVVKPALNEGKIVLCDRYIDSTVAYQGYGRGISIEKLNSLNNIATSSLEPNLTLLFDIDTMSAGERVGKTKDRLESAGLEFHNKVRMGYLDLSKKYSRIKVINSEKTIDEVFEQTKSHVLELLAKWKKSFFFY